MGEACGTLIRLKSNDFHPESKQDQSETFPKYEGAWEGMVLILFSQKSSSLGWVLVGPGQVLLMPPPCFSQSSPAHASLSDETLMKSPNDKRSHFQNALQPSVSYS